MQLVTETPLLEHHHCQQLVAANNNQLNPQSLHQHYQQQDQNIEQQQQQQQQLQQPQQQQQQQQPQQHQPAPNLEDLTHNTSTNNITLPIDSTYTITQPIATELRLDTTDKLIHQAETATASSPLFIAPQAVDKSYSLPTTNTTSTGNRRMGIANMNIQPTGYTKNHVINNGSASHLNSGLSTDELSMKRRREDLSRRPSYRKIFNDLTGLSGPLDPPTAPPLGLGAPVASNDAATNSSVGVNRVSPQQTITTAGRTPRPPTTSPSPQSMDLLSSVGATTSINLQDPSATNSQSPVSVVDLPTSAVQQHPTTSQPQHHHNIQTNHLQAPHLHPSSTQRHHIHHHHQQQQQQQPPQLNQAHHVPQPHEQQHPQQQQQQQQQQQAPQRPIHQIMTPTSPPITGSGSLSSGSGGGNGEEATKKRELRLQKNREAAKECRRKKKEYIKCLENRVAVLENQNKALIDELKTLKDLYCKSANE